MTIPFPPAGRTTNTAGRTTNTAGRSAPAKRLFGERVMDRAQRSVTGR
ncbi:MAG: hypothetical protein OEW12_00110 [Deltaproteobacteria bacterium]|nr:hypothetical protein [Deltaproteobacteria bacterium]